MPIESSTLGVARFLPDAQALLGQIGYSVGAPWQLPQTSVWHHNSAGIRRGMHHYFSPHHVLIRSSNQDVCKFYALTQGSTVATLTAAVPHVRILSLLSYMKLYDRSGLPEGSECEPIKKSHRKTDSNSLPETPLF